MYDVLNGETMVEYWRGIKEGVKFDKEQSLDAFNPVGWRKHNDWHFSKKVNGNRIDYYPSTKVILLNGKRQKSKNVEKLLQKLREAKNDTTQN